MKHTKGPWKYTREKTCNIGGYGLLTCTPQAPCKDPGCISCTPIYHVPVTLDPYYYPMDTELDGAVAALWGEEGRTAEAYSKTEQKAHKCHCDITTLMQSGCKCGGT